MSREVIIGVDLGASKILSGIGTSDGQILQKTKQLTPHGNASSVIDLIADNILEWIKIAEAQHDSVKGIAVAVPGPVTYPGAVIEDSPNLGWQRVEFKEELSRRLGRPVVVDKDTNLAALGEYHFGQDRKYAHLLYLTVSTGVGGGIIINDRLYHGWRGGGGEFGHMVIDASGPECSCGRRGCLEAVASGTAVTKQIEALIKAGRGQNIAACGCGSAVGAPELGKAARKGDPEALKLIKELGQNLGIGIANLVHLFNPQIVVIGGGVMIGLGDLLLEPIKEYVGEKAFPLHRRDLIIETTTLGNDIGLYGCIAAIAHGI